MRKFRAAAIPVLCTVLVAAGCSSDKKAATTTTAAPATTVADTAAPTTAGPTTTAAPKYNWDAIVADANKEGEVAIYSVFNPAVFEKVQAEFNKLYPKIKLVLLRGSSNELIARMEQEAASGVGGADMFTLSDVAWSVKAGTDGKLTTPIGPDADKWPTEYANGNVIFGSMEPFGIMYNTELVKTPITGYADLLRPELKGKIGINATSTAVAITAYYEWLAKSFTPTFTLEKLKAQEPKFYANTPAGAQAAVAGEVAVYASGTPGTPLSLAAQGAPIKFVVPKPSFSAQIPMGILKAAKHPNAAMVFTNFLMSKAGQTVWHVGFGTASALKVTDIDPKDLYFYDPAKFTPAFVAETNANLDKILK